jgi:hypothetical protein
MPDASLPTFDAGPRAGSVSGGVDIDMARDTCAGSDVVGRAVEQASARPAPLSRTLRQQGDPSCELKLRD